MSGEKLSSHWTKNGHEPKKRCFWGYGSARRARGRLQRGPRTHFPWFWDLPAQLSPANHHPKSTDEPARRDPPYAAAQGPAGQRSLGDAGWVKRASAFASAGAGVSRILIRVPASQLSTPGCTSCTHSTPRTNQAKSACRSFVTRGNVDARTRGTERKRARVESVQQRKRGRTTSEDFEDDSLFLPFKNLQTRTERKMRCSLQEGRQTWRDGAHKRECAATESPSKVLHRGV